MTRTRTLRAWTLLAAYLLALVLLLVTSRAPAFGGSLGLQYRYFTDAACVLVLCLGLAFLPVPGAPGGSDARPRPLLRPPVPHRAWIPATCLVCASAMFSSTWYVHHWQTGNASAAYVDRLQTELGRRGTVDLADAVLPEPVMQRFLAPHNLVSSLTPLLPGNARFPRASSRLAMVARDGSLERAAIEPGVVVDRQGSGCGWRIGPSGRTIRFRSSLFPYVWWIRIGYLASAASPVRVSAGTDSIDTEIQPGANSLYVRVHGSVDSVRIDALTGAVMCVDRLEAGELVPGGRL